MNDAGLEKIRAAYQELEAARQEWRREFASARLTLRDADLLSVAQRLDEAFERFRKASEALLSGK